jgi:hypothetical protein
MIPAAIVFGVPGLAFICMIAFFFAQNMGAPGWLGPVGVVLFIGAGIGVILWAKWEAAHSRAKALQAIAEAKAQIAVSFPTRLHHALWKMGDPVGSEWEAAQMWARLGLGHLPNQNTGDPGNWPRLLPWPDRPGKADPWGVEETAVGALARFTMVDGRSVEDWQKKVANMAAEFDVPEVRVWETDGEQVVLELRTKDPITQTRYSPLVDIVQTTLPDGSPHTVYLLRIPVDGLSVHQNIPVGPSEYGSMLTVNIAEDDHLAIAGTTRAGKSVFVNNILAPALLMRDCKVALVDPNGATSPPWHQCVDLLCDTRDVDQAIKVLEEVFAEIERRQPLFARLRVAKLTQFSPKLPAWLVVVEEAANYKNNPKFMEIMEKIGTQGAKYGVKLVVIAQKMSGENVPTGARAQLSGRVTFRVNDPQDYRMLFANAPQFAEDIQSKAKTPQGVGIASLPCHPDPVRFRALFLPDEGWFAIGDAIAAARGAVRPLPGYTPELPAKAAPPALPATTESNTSATASDAARRPADATGSKPAQLPPLPKIPQLGRDGKVIPFDRNTRTDRPETDGTTAPGQDTGTE